MGDNAKAVANVLAQVTGPTLLEVIALAQEDITEQDAITRLQAIREAANPSLDTGIPPLSDR